MLLWLHVVIVQPARAGQVGDESPNMPNLMLLMLKSASAPQAPVARGMGTGMRGWGAPADVRSVDAVFRRIRTRLYFKRRPRPALRSVRCLGPGPRPAPDLPHHVHAHVLGHTRRCDPVRRLAAVVNCGASLNTPPISAASLTKEEVTHAIGDSAQGLSSGLHVSTPVGIDSSAAVPNTSGYCEPLISTATDQQTSQWLQKHRFGAHLRTFNSFCGADLLRLTRDDLIQICGVADGIRLFNALHAKSLTPRLTIYLTHVHISDDNGNPKTGIYRALYLDSLSRGELSMRLASHFGLSLDHITDVFLEGPQGIRVLVTDDVVQHMKNDSLFTVEICQDHTREHYCLLLKPSSK